MINAQKSLLRDQLSDSRTSFTKSTVFVWYRALQNSATPLQRRIDDLTQVGLATRSTGTHSTR